MCLIFRYTESIALTLQCLDKKNFRYDGHSDTTASTPNTSAPTTPTLSYSVPAIQFTYNPSIYNFRNTPISLTRKGSHCSATSGWKGGLPSVPEADVYVGVEVGEDR